MENKVRNIVRGAIFMAACVFLLYGITRGEVVVVFTKAVNICLECIGLG
ncbi:MAG: thioredoxin [Lachnospiraceae bacterium]